MQRVKQDHRHPNHQNGKIRAAKTIGTFCPICLANTGKRFIMLESDTAKYKDMGGGFFEKEIDK